MKKKNKIPTIIAVVILTLATFLGVLAVNYRQVFRIGASADTSPKDVRVSNLGDSTATVSWTTDKETTGFINYGESAGSLGQIASNEMGEASFVHYADLPALKPQTRYYFKINSGGENFDNNGTLWQVTTGNKLPEQGVPFIISGSVLTSTGTPGKKTVVYINIGGYLLSTPTSDNGTFVVQLANTRTADLSAWASINPSQTLLEISVQSGAGGVATAQVYPQSAKPIPPIIIGKTNDFKNLPPSSDETDPNASLEIPQGETPESKFTIPDDTTAPSAKAVTLDSLKDGEVVTSTKPEFFGKGPAGENMTITVESDPITEDVKIPTSGNWNWNLPQTLEEGVHKITISWKDAQGITRKLTRSFIVQAGEAPAFVSTPSAPTAPSPTPTSTPTPTPKVKTPLTTVEPLPSVTPVPIPATGSLTPTWILSIIGLGVIAFSFVFWRMSEG